MYRGVQSRSNMVENQERCLKCGKQQGLQGVAVTIGRRTFHLFYLCSKCGNVNIEELLRIIGSYKEKKTT
jgi:predicted nucleic-acid-binding Zn-ribbon protein